MRHLAGTWRYVVGNTQEITPRNLAVADAAKYLGIGPWAMRQLHWDGVVRGFFIGRRLLFDKLVLDAYVDRLVKEAN